VALPGANPPSRESYQLKILTFRLILNARGSNPSTTTTTTTTTTRRQIFRHVKEETTGELHIEELHDSHTTSL
jgi:hypothetical protein